MSSDNGAGQGCRGCHGVDNGTGDGIPNFNFDDQWSTGLRAFHDTQTSATCSSCHSSDRAPEPENTFPVNYPTSLGVSDPCSDNLDNDGNGLFDGEDLMACLAKGDVNGSGVADLADVILSLQVAGGMTPAGIVHKEADINNDQKVGIPEAVWIMSNSGL